MFRITPFSAAQTTIYHNRNQMARLGKLQFQASSGLKYSKPSDNPIENNKIGRLSRTLANLQSQRTRISDVQQPLNNSVTNLIEAKDLISRARQIAQQAPQAFGDGSQNALADELDSILARFQSIANSEYQGQYLYAGAASDTMPFQLIDDPGLGIPSVQYEGSLQDAETVISDSISIQSAFSGSRIFMSQGRGETQFFGSTGAASGAGTDSEIGRANLQVLHKSTTYAPGSGVVAGTDSVDGDTVIGAAGTHTLTITDSSGLGTSGEVSLNGGPSIPWDNSQTNLQVTGKYGEVVFIDTTAITAGFTGTIDIEGSGALSLDGGATEIPIDFSTNQVVENSLTGNVVHVDSSGIQYAGAEALEFEGTADAITAILELKDDLLNNRGLEASELNQAFERRLQDLERISDQLLDNVGQQSVALQQLDQMAVQNENHQMDLNVRLSEVESADLAKVIVEMQSVQTTMQFNYAALSIVQSNNLLDFLG